MTATEIRTASTMSLLNRHGDLVHVWTKASLRERDAIDAELARR